MINPAITAKPHSYWLAAKTRTGIPTFVPGFVEPERCGPYLKLLDEQVSWESRTAPRDECFMALDTTLTYTYGKPGPSQRTYTAVAMHGLVAGLLGDLNWVMNAGFNVCVLNRYEGQHQHLGWHADDSPEQDRNHPIAVISFGAERYLHVRESGHKGLTPPENQFLMTPGSVLVMPVGYQDTHQHKIPKHSGACGKRISLTFRKLDR